MSYFDSKHLRAAKALTAQDWSHPKLISAARKMAHAGASTAEIRDAIWPAVTQDTARKRLKRFNIRGRDKMDRARFGEITHFPGDSQINLRSFKPRSAVMA